MARGSSKRNQNQNPKPSQAKLTAPDSIEPAGRSAGGVPIGLFLVAATALVFAAIMSGMLVLEHLIGLNLPGCGKGSACAQAAASVWGKVPYLNWPVAYLGFAYFFAALVAWLGAQEGIPASFKNLVRFGALISLGFVAVIIYGEYHCWYCLGSHAGNFAFWLCVEFAGRSHVRSKRPLAAVIVVFLLASAALAAVEVRQKRLVGEKNERELNDSVAQIAAAASQKSTSPSGLPATSILPVQDASTTQPTSAGAPATQRAQAPSDDRFPAGLTGRWRWGPEKAPIRVVMLTDYQCTDCNKIEADVRKMMSERTDVSLSIKHFPMCADCNPHFQEQNMHPNACWAARAAEAAGILRGNDGFWQMHHWLFDHQGNFTNDQLKQALTEMGFDIQQFHKLMESPETLAPVQSDIEDGVWLGLHFTPMVFINGVELVGVFAPQAIPRAVAAVAAKNPPPMGPENDRPPPAMDKCVGDWRQAAPISMPPDAASWSMGAKDAPIQIIMWGDYQESWTAKADEIIRKWMAGRTDTQYVFRHFPFDQACNAEVPRTGHPQACRASQAAEAAGRLAGGDGYWKMHEWLMTHQAEVNDETIRRAASEMGFNPDVFFVAMNGSAVRTAIEEDCKAGKPLLYRGGIPTIYVNRKVLPRWHVDGKFVLERILDEAARQR